MSIYFIKKSKINKTLAFFIAFGILLSFISCKKTELGEYKIVKQSTFVQQAAVTAHPEASRIANEILEKGGNAIDAAIATQFALAVCYPNAGNIGGGGFMVYRSKDGEVNTLDFREKAPSKSSVDMYLDSNGEVVEGLSTLGHLSSGVPGSVDGMHEAFLKYSALKDWGILLEPAIELARNGFRLTERQANELNAESSDFKKVNSEDCVFIKNSNFKTGELFIQSDLANTLDAIKIRGRAGFYEGEIAEKIISEQINNGGIMRLEDLSAYHSVWRKPISFDYKNYKMYSMPPPSSGGILLAQLFKAIEEYPISKWGMHDKKTIHLIVEAEKRAYADRAKFIGDTDFVPVPVNDLVKKEYMKIRMSDFDSLKASAPDSIEAGKLESEETTHFSIVDKFGNAVSITTTLNGSYGSHVIVDGAGFIMNNEMDDFSAKVGVANMYGLVGAEANKIEPGKRMLSSMTPTIVEQNGDLFMVVGTPGGSTIITSVFQTIVNVIEHNQSIDDAVQNCRFHHQWKPSEVFIEENCFSADLIKELEVMGHIIETREPIGRVDAILIKDGKIMAAADKRGDDCVAGK